MKMRELCERTGMSKRNVHYYIKEGLLSPRQDQVNGYYEFSENDVCCLMMIRSLRDAGFSIIHIRSVLQSPTTAVYYMNLRLKQVRSEITRLKKLEESLFYMQQNLPIHPSLSDVEQLVKKAAIPSEIIKSDASDMPDDNDSDLVNRYLWENFLPDEPFSEYQEYLWSKINRYTAGRYEADYRRISKTLHNFTGTQIKSYFSDNRQMHKEMILLEESSYASYAERMKRAIRRFLTDPASLKWWKTQYDTLLAPSTRLYDSEMAGTMEELSPLFASYRKNVNAVCALVYDWLHTPEGETLFTIMREQLGDTFDIDGCSHGQLQGMASVFVHDITEPVEQ